jgi:hypothetical protein
MSGPFRAAKNLTYELPMDYYLYKETLAPEAAGTLAPPRAGEREGVRQEKMSPELNSHEISYG